LWERLRVRAASRPWAVFASLIILQAVLGCRSPYYKAASLPAEFQAQPAAASTAINLERMAGRGDGTSQIAPGDLVEITIVSGSGEDRPASMPARISNDGMVMVPIIGGVPIGGLEPVVAEQRIAALAVERGVYRQPYVTLTVKERAVHRVTVLGAVAKPGVVELPRGACDLASALAAAGGMTKEASTRIEILHHSGLAAASASSPSDERQPSSEITPAAYSELTVSTVHDPPVTHGKSHIDLTQPGPAGVENRQLEDRDVVMVLPEETPVIHVTGLVTKPNQFELTKGKDIRVLDAIALAGGTSSPVADKVYVIRHLPDRPEPVVVKLSMAAAKRDGRENLRLAPGDLVTVESTFSTMTLDTISKFFRVAFGVSGSMTTF
jgi:polysaccharide biosynthesis/export protein